MIATGIIALPMVKRPALLVASTCVLGLTVYFGLDLLPAATVQRISDLSTGTRQGVWEGAYELISDAPIFGHGWVYNAMTGSIATANQHSMYLQVLVEIGFVGLAVMMLSLLLVIWQALMTLRETRFWQLPVAPVYLGYALLSCVISGGAFEGGPMVGTTINALYFGFSIGLLGATRPMLVLAQQQADYVEPEPEYHEEYFVQEDVF